MLHTHVLRPGGVTLGLTAPGSENLPLGAGRGSMPEVALGSPAPG